ncbi:MAG: 3-deoxy-8-phosphooctulonate synthase [Deltaproteobacteria bacterium]|nr:3-deoxy-8-phosphooctulonate synthase [Deltaproteobacteria bacterium]
MNPASPPNPTSPPNPASPTSPPNPGPVLIPNPAADAPAIEVGRGRLVLFAGPCVLEDSAFNLEHARRLRAIADGLRVPLVFKASFDKANRTRGSSARGPGLDQGLACLAEVKSAHRLPIITDVHHPEQCAPVAEVADVLQIPAFLCRQTDLLRAAGATGRVVNIKKGQFLAPEDMAFAVEKVRDAAGAGGGGVLVTERGTSFGYRDLVVDFRSLGVMRRFAPVVFDGTHSVQRPGSLSGRTGGDRTEVPALVRAAVGYGVDALFLEVHPDPERAPSDGPNSLDYPSLLKVLTEAMTLRKALESLEQDSLEN